MNAEIAPTPVLWCSVFLGTHNTGKRRACLCFCGILTYILYSLLQAYQHKRSPQPHTKLSLCILGVAWNVTGVKTFPLSSLFLTLPCRQRHLWLSLHYTAIFETKGGYIYFLCVWCLTLAHVLQSIYQHPRSIPSIQSSSPPAPNLCPTCIA